VFDAAAAAPTKVFLRREDLAEETRDELPAARLLLRPLRDWRRRSIASTVDPTTPPNGGQRSGRTSYPVE
jgi:hypothetical protein